jgi:FAD:protein FMN transferase
MFQRILSGFIIVLAATALLTSCEERALRPVTGKFYSGEFLGRSYSIDAVGDSADYAPQIDSILREIALACDLRNPNSILSRYNAHQDPLKAFVFTDSTRMFGAIYSLASDLHRKTRGMFDPTMNPIRRAWQERQEMGWTKGEPDLDELFRYTVFDGAKVDLDEVTASDGYTYVESRMRKSDPRIELDFTALAGAYAMDRLAAFLDERAVPQWKISYGQSTMVSGALADSLNIIGMGISADSSDQKIYLPRGAYSFRTPADKAYMIDPTYGYPPRSSEVFFAGVVAPSMAEASVFAEAFMIMGLAEAASWNEEQTDGRIQSFMLIQRESEITSASTEGFDRLLLLNRQAEGEETP